MTCVANKNEIDFSSGGNIFEEFDKMRLSQSNWLVAVSSFDRFQVLAELRFYDIISNAVGERFDKLNGLVLVHKAVRVDIGCPEHVRKPFFPCLSSCVPR